MKILEKIHTTTYHLIQMEPTDAVQELASCSVFVKHGEVLDHLHQLERQDLSELLAGIPKHSALIIGFTGEQVLTRYSSTQGENLFEEIEEDEFYIQNTQSRNGWSIKSACRKEKVDKILTHPGFKNHFILSVGIGCGSLAEFENLVQDSRVEEGHLQFVFDKGLLHTIQERHDEESCEKEIVIGGSAIPGTGVLDLANLLHYLKGDELPMKFIDEQKVQYGFFRKFRKFGLAALLILFLGLLINFFLISEVRNDLQVLQSGNENHVSKVNQIKILQSRIDEYKKLMHVPISSPEESYSYYLDEIAETRTSGVWFDALEMYPPMKKPEKNKLIEFDREIILLKGEAKNPVCLNDFIGALKERPWIQDIELINYENSNEKAHADFEINIKKKR